MSLIDNENDKDANFDIYNSRNLMSLIDNIVVTLRFHTSTIVEI